MRIREPPKGILRVFVQFQFILPTKKNKTKQKTSIQKHAEEKKEQNKAKDKYTETRRSNVVRKPKKKPFGLGNPLFVRLASNRLPGFGWVGR